MLCSRFGEHPRWQAGKRAVGLQNDCHFDVVRDETPFDDDGFTELRMVRVVDLGFRRVFAGSMPCDRAEAEPLEGYQSFCRSAPPLSGALNVRGNDLGHKLQFAPARYDPSAQSSARPRRLTASTIWSVACPLT